MSNAASAQLLISPETVFGEAPAVGPGPTMQNLRFITEGLNSGAQFETSEEIDSSRSRIDQILVGYNAAGPTNHEMSAATFDLLLEAAICGTWTANVVQNGSVLRSFLIERGLVDAGQYFNYRGMEIEGFTLTIDSKKRVMISFDWMGTKVYRTTASVAGTVTAKTVTPVFSSGPFITGLAANTNMTGIKIRSLRLQLKNNLRARDTVDALVTSQHGRGVQEVEGNFEAYFADGALHDQFIANGEIDFSFAIGDGAKSYTFRMPKMKLPEVTDPQVGGLDTDVVLPVKFQGFKDATLGYHLKVTRVP